MKSSTINNEYHHKHTISNNRKQRKRGKQNNARNKTTQKTIIKKPLISYAPNRKHQIHQNAANPNPSTSNPTTTLTTNSNNNLGIIIIRMKPHQIILRATKLTTGTQRNSLLSISNSTMFIPMGTTPFPRISNLTLTI